MLEMISAAAFSSYQMLVGTFPGRAFELLLVPCLLAILIARNALSRIGLLVLVGIPVLAMPLIGYSAGAFHFVVIRPHYLNLISGLLYVITLAAVVVSVPYYLISPGAIERRKSLLSTTLNGVNSLLLLLVGSYFWEWCFLTAAWASSYRSFHLVVVSEVSMMVLSFALLILIPSAAGALIGWKDTVATRKLVLAVATVPWLLATRELLEYLNSMLHIRL